MPETGTANPSKERSAAKPDPLHKSLLKKYTVKLVAASSVRPIILIIIAVDSRLA